MQDGHSSELKTTLIAKLTEMAGQYFYEINANTIERIQQIVEKIVDTGIAESCPDISDDGKLSILYCEDCHDAPCCIDNKEIGICFNDIRHLTKELGISQKRFIKDHLKRFVGDNSTEGYVLKYTNPCEFLDENTRCRVYPARPLVCRIFPFDFNESKTPILSAYEYCNYGFNMMKHQCCLLYTSPSPRDGLLSRMPSSA